MKQKPKRKRSIIVRVAVLFVAVYMVVTLIAEGNKYAELKAQENQLNQQKETLQLEIQEIQTLLDSGSHKEIIEQAARDRLGYVYSDEEIYIDISGN